MLNFIWYIYKELLKSPEISGFTSADPELAELWDVRDVFNFLYIINCKILKFSNSYIL